MKHARLGLGLVLFAFFVANGGTGAQQPSPTPPAIELHRTAAAAYFEPARARTIFALVIGSDVRSGDPSRGRADSIHIVGINTRTGAGTIVGIPRDSWVPVGGAPQKINASLVAGGARATVATVSRLSGIKFHYWALTEFTRFTRLVDRLGGLDVVVPYPMQDLQFSGANFRPGRRHMNGGHALAFARNRKATPHGDFSRSENQGRLLIAGLSKFRGLVHDPRRLAKALLAFRSEVVSDVPAGELLSLARTTTKINPRRIRNLVLPGTAGNAGGASVVFLSPAANEIFKRIRDDAVF